MANITFGNTIRAHDALAIKNLTAYNLYIPFLRVTLAPSSTKYLNFEIVDQFLRSYLKREGDLYTINASGTAFHDDIGVLAALITGGQIMLYYATNSTTDSITGYSYSLGASATFSTTSDGSVTYS